MVISPSKHIGRQILAITLLQGSSTVAYAVFYSGLSIFLIQNKHYIPDHASLITGLFLSLSYFLPLLGGMIAHKIISYKNLFYLGLISSIAACFMLMQGIYFHFSLALFLLGSLSNMCINIFITQLFFREQKTQRRIAFTWNYIGMNMGFMLGYVLTGFSTLANNYYYLFQFMSFMLFVSIFITYFFIKEPVLKSIYVVKKYDLLKCIVLFGGLIITVKLLFDYAEYINAFLLTAFCATSLTVFAYVLYKIKQDHQKIILFMLYSLFLVLFWSIYLLTPISIMQLIFDHAELNFLGVNIAPQWLTNINGIVILTIAPLTTWIVSKNIKKSAVMKVNFFTAAFVFIAIAILVLAFGVQAMHLQGKIPLIYIVGYLIAASLGEIFITPASYSLVGELIQEEYRGIMLGMLSMNMAIGGFISSIISGAYIIPWVNNRVISVNGLQLDNVFFIICAILILIAILSAFLDTSKISYATAH